MGTNFKLRNDVEGAEEAEKAESGGYDGNFPSTPAQTAAYISDMVKELQLIAKRANLKFLAYLLELASEEAEWQKNRGV